METNKSRVHFSRYKWIWPNGKVVTNNAEGNPLDTAGNSHAESAIWRAVAEVVRVGGKITVELHGQTHEFESGFGEVASEITIVNRASKLDTQETISQEELQALRFAKAELDALYAEGVDNWEGYEYAMDRLND